MKRTYDKPEVNFVSFALTEAIAACSEYVYFNHVQGSCTMNPIFEGATLTVDNSCDAPIEGYCYYSSANAGALFNS